MIRRAVAGRLWLGLACLLVACIGSASNPVRQEEQWQGKGQALRLGAHTLRADDESLALAQAAGFDSVVQVFAWREIEPTRGQFHWEVTDQVVAGAEYYGLDLVVRLDQHPAWVSQVQPPLNAPPDVLVDYQRFVERVAWRYRGRIRAYIIWNEPNLALEWAGRAPDPAAYVALLKAGYQGVRAGDPQALVVAAGLAPTNGHGERAMDERSFLRAIYRAGGAAYFDVLGAHPYGFDQPPDAPVSLNEGLVFGRLAELRAIMLDHGDGDKQVWITEMGWTVQPPPDQPDLSVSLDQQAAYLVAAVERVRHEWPWVELVTVWNLSQPAPEDPFGGYSLIDAEGKPRPAYEALREAAGELGRGRTRTLAPRPVRRSRGGLPARASVNADRKRISASVCWLGSPRPSCEVVQVLGEDVVIHLGDSELGPAWWPLYAGRRPSIAWTGGFYLYDPGRADWTLALELMQQNELGARVAVNGVRLAPDLPLGDFAHRWLTVRRRVPVSALRPGYNEVTVSTASLSPDLQHDEFVWDDFQIRNLRLLAASPG